MPAIITLDAPEDSISRGFTLHLPVCHFAKRLMRARCASSARRLGAFLPLSDFTRRDASGYSVARFVSSLILNRDRSIECHFATLISAIVLFLFRLQTIKIMLLGGSAMLTSLTLDRPQSIVLLIPQWLTSLRPTSRRKVAIARDIRVKKEKKRRTSDRGADDEAVITDGRDRFEHRRADTNERRSRVST